MNFNLQVILKASTVKNSTSIANYKSASFKKNPSKLVVGKPKIVFKLKTIKKKGRYVYKKYYIYNKGNSFGSKKFTKKISSKYKLTKLKYNKHIIKYKKSAKKFSIGVKNLLPYSFNKKNIGILKVVLKKRY